MVARWYSMDGLVDDGLVGFMVGTWWVVASNSTPSIP